MEGFDLTGSLVNSRSRTFGIILLLIVIVLIIALVKNAYYISILTFIAINSLIAIGLCLLMGYAGQISLGHAAFYGLGAYTSAILTTKLAWSPWLSLPVAIMLTCLIAYLIGRPTLHLKGHYLAMATLGFGVIVHIVMKEWLSLTGGNSGLTSIPALSIAGIPLDSERKIFCLASLIMVAVLLFSANLAASRAGRALQSVHSSEVAASTSGVNIARYKLKVFVLSAGFAAIAGFLYSHYVKFISPQPFDFKFSIELVLMVVLGGVGSVWGGLLGAGIVTILGEALRKFGHYDIIVFGTILMIVIIFFPQGIAGELSRLYRAWMGRRSKDTSSGKEMK